MGFKSLRPRPSDDGKFWTLEKYQPKKVDVHSEIPSLNKQVNALKGAIKALEEKLERQDEYYEEATRLTENKVDAIADYLGVDLDYQEQIEAHYVARKKESSK